MTPTPTTPKIRDEELGVIRAIWLSTAAATWLRESGIPPELFATKRGRIVAGYAMYDRTSSQPQDVMEALTKHEEGEMALGSYLAQYEDLTDEQAVRDVQRYAAALSERWMKVYLDEWKRSYDQGGMRRADAVTQLSRLLDAIGAEL